ncbi:MAG TPA: MFS transporter [Candidatus Dormibacteraeota bacterium]|nr:MFS transporter [Candidatus Dormibacteraeota bacterium]
MTSKGRDSGIPGLSSSGQTHAVAASFLGWTLDAFDFFVVVFLIDKLAVEFHVGKGAVIASLFVTLVMRPVGALIFGLMTDRYGRRIPLMANVVFFSVVELACGFSPNFTFFLVMRALYGIGMGGEWGIGASLAMESVPARWRGILSGILQSGYSFGYLLAAIVARFVLPTWGWRPMFWLGGLPALLAFYISYHVPESEAWKQHRAPSTGAVLKIVATQWKSFLYLVLLMTFMMFLSHGTQDLYPDFLGSVHKLSPAMQSYMAMLYNVGAILGAIVFGQFSDKLGRRFTMIMALVLALVVIPFWAFGTSIVVLAIAAFLMQAGVQGAWGVIPVHLTELSADATRGLVPGLAYQLGILIAAPTNTVEFMLREHVGYQWALAGFEIVTISVLIVTIALGKERKGRSFHQPPIAVGVE